jgi:hypothetical protein
MSRSSAPARDLRRKPRAIAKKRHLWAEPLESRLLLSAASVTTMLSANANAYVEQTTPTANYGSSAYLLAENLSGSNQYDSYLKFSLAALAGQTVTSATLELSPTMLGTSAAAGSASAINVQIVPTTAANFNWSEGTGGTNSGTTGAITWSNRPQVPATATAALGSAPAGLQPAISLTGVATTAGSTTVTVASTTGLLAGMNVFGPNIPGGATVVSVTNSKAFVLSAAATATATGGTAATGISFNVTALVNQQFATNQTLSFLVDTTSAANMTNWVDFASRENSTSAFRPTLVVVTTPQTLNSISVSPATVSVSSGAQQTFTATALDLNGNAMATQPAFSWTVNGGIGTINTSGVFTAATTLTNNLSGSVSVTAGGFTGKASVTVTASDPTGLNDPALVKLVTPMLAATNNSLTYADMLTILQAVAAENKVLSATDMHDLNVLLGDTTGYVQVLSTDVIGDSNLADGHYQGQVLAKLTAGGSATVLTDLTDKWFLGTDLPSTAGVTSPTPTYSSTATYAGNPLFPGGAANSTVGAPSFSDLHQGTLGDCYFLSAMASVADASTQTVASMFIPDGGGVYTVRFYTSNGTADYVTVNSSLPVSYGSLAFDGMGVPTGSVNLWLPLAEKAYAEWNETGNEIQPQTGVNTYAAISGGWMGNVYSEVLPGNVSQFVQNQYWTSTSGVHLPTSVTIGGVVVPTGSVAPQAIALETWLIDALQSSTTAVTMGTDSTLPTWNPNIGDYWDAATGIIASHAYVVRSVAVTTPLTATSLAAATFVLYNPWGSNQPTGPLTWNQLYADCDYFADVNVSGSGLGSPGAGVNMAKPAGLAPLRGGDSGGTATAVVSGAASTAALDAGPSATMVGGGSPSASEQIYASPQLANSVATNWQIADSVVLHDEGQETTGLSADAVDALLANGSVFRKTAWI